MKKISNTYSHIGRNPSTQSHNTYRLPTEEEINDPNFEYEVGEEFEQIVYTKLLKSKPKMYANYTHAILCGNGGGRSSTFAWFFKNKINCRPYDRSSSKWISKKATCLNDSVN